MNRRDVSKLAAGLAACLVLGWFAFVRGDRVPLLGGVDLGFHELGHMLTYVLPDLITAAMGSITQVAVPLGIAVYFLWRRDFLGGGVCLAWAGTSAQDASVYIADAPYEALQLIGGEHDWAFILGPENFNMLDKAHTIAGVVKGFGLLLLIAGCCVCVAGPLLKERPDEDEPATDAPAGGAAGWAVIPPWEKEGEAR